MDLTPAQISDFERAQMIAEYGGTVESQFAKSSVMRTYVNIRGLRGTDTLVNRRVGRTTLQGINDTNKGTEPTPGVTTFGKVQVTVDTIVLARDVRTLLNEFQTDFDARSELAMDHGKEMGKFFDQSFLIQCIKGAQTTLSAADKLGGAFGDGKVETLSAVNDEKDPTKLTAAIRRLITKYAEDDIDRNELIVWVRPSEFQTLLDADKLVNMDYSAWNGDYAMGRLAMIEGARIIETARIPTTATGAGDHHILSNAANSYAYDVSATDAKTAAVVMHPRSLLAAETISMVSDIWYNKEELRWYIQSLMAYGVTPNRPDLCGAVLKA